MSVEQIQALVDGLAARLGRAVLVDDRDLRLVAASEDFGDADPARVWSLLHRRTRPEDVRHEEITRLDGPGYVPENPVLELWQRLCVPVRCQGLLLGFMWVTDRYGEISPGAGGRSAADRGADRRAAARPAGGRRAGPRRCTRNWWRRCSARTPRRGTRRGTRRSTAGCSTTAARWPCCSSGAPEAATPRLARPSSLTWNGSSATRPGVRALAAYLAAAGHRGRHRPARGEDWRGAAPARCARDREGGPWRVAVGGPVPGPGGLPAARRQADIALSTLRAGGDAPWPAGPS